MTTVPFDRSTVGMNSALGRTVPKPQVPKSHPAGDIVEWEYSDAMRLSRLPAGWFLLPSAVLGASLLIALLY